MKNTFLSVALLTVSSISLAAPIIGGENVPVNDAQGVFIFFANDEEGYLSGSCTASKIGSKYIITAAHCISSSTNIIGWSNAGTIDLEDDNSVLYGLHIKKVNVHPTYEIFNLVGQSYKSKDIAILEVDTTKGNYVKKFLDLPSLELDFSPVVSGENLQTYGYGCEKVGDLDNPTSNKKMTNIETLPYSALDTHCSAIAPVINQNSSEIFKSQIVSSSLASGGQASLCEGDSGGPVLRGGKIVGINSQAIIDQTAESDESFLTLHSRLSEVKSWVAEKIK